MKSISDFRRILIALGLLIFFAGPLRADPLVTFFVTSSTGTSILRLDPFIAGTTDANGLLSVRLRNATQFTFQDFHFETESLQGARWMGDGTPFFSDFSSTSSRIDFVVGGTGTGIQPGENFLVGFTGFLPNTIIRGTATIPEPATVFLLSSGLAGVAIKLRKKLKKRKS